MSGGLPAGITYKINKKMKKLFLSLVFLISGLGAQAQFAKLDRYPQIPASFDNIFVDVVRNYAAGVLHSNFGQYFGQFTPEGEAYGYGVFFTDPDGQIIGQFYKGELLQGIRMGSESVQVGTTTHYTVYNLKTAEVECIMKDGIRYLPDAERKDQWKYVQMKYANGAKYVGETVNGKRDGFGIYYYADGDYYFGRFADDKPIGYGAIFKTDNRVLIQCWDKEQ